MDFKTVYNLFLCVCFFEHCIPNSAAARQNIWRTKSRHPDRLVQITDNEHVYRDLKIGDRIKVNKMSLSSWNFKKATSKPRVVKRKPIPVKSGTQTTEYRQLIKSQFEKMLTTENRKHSVTSNAFIEFDMRRAFVPKIIITNNSKYISHTQKPLKKSHVSYLLNKASNSDKTVSYEKKIESDSESVNIDSTVLDRIQQLEHELVLMKKQVKNDSETIDHLKSKILQKDKELTAFSLTSQFLSPNKNNVIHQRKTTLRQHFRSVKLMSTINSNLLKTSTKNQRETTEKPQLYVPNKISFIKNESVHQVIVSDTDNNNKPNKYEYKIVEGQKEFNSDLLIKDEEQAFKSNTEINEGFDSTTIYKHITTKHIADGEQPNQNFDKFQVVNQTDMIYDQDSDYDKLNVSDKNTYYKEDYGQVNPGDNGFGINKNNDFMNPEEYHRKLYEERIDAGIDWKNFNPQLFLSQLSSEMKARSKPPPEYVDFHSLIRNSGRRMLSDNKFNLTNEDSLLTLNKDKQRKYEEISTKNFYAPLPPKQRKLVLTTIIPEPTEPLSLNLNGVNADNIFHLTSIHSTPKTSDETGENINPELNRRKLAPPVVKQKLIIDSTELLIRNFLGNLNKGRSNANTPYDFEVIKQRLNRESGKRRQMLHEKIAHRMAEKISGRRNMDPGEIGHGNYDSQELFRDPFLNDSLI